MRYSSVQVARQHRVSRGVALSATRSGISGVAAPIRQVLPRNRPLNEVPAHPSFSNSPEPLWVPTTGASGLVDDPLVQRLWCEALGDDLVVGEVTNLARAPLMLHFDGITQFRVQVDEPPAPPGSQKSPDYYANVGDAIRTLREDIPQLFEKDLNYEIYRDEIVFRDPRLSFQGKDNYKIIFWSLRFHGKLFFSKLYVDVLRIWQPEDHQIKMRWRIVGVPRVWWKTDGTIDGISTYKLDSEGKIYEHSVDNVQLRDPPITNPLLYGLNYILSPSLQGEGGQVPCPGSWFTGEAGELSQ